MDRFRVLEDIFMCEYSYSENKRLLINSYLEAYEHADGHSEQQQLAQIVFIVFSVKVFLLSITHCCLDPTRSWISLYFDRVMILIRIT